MPLSARPADLLHVGSCDTDLSIVAYLAALHNASAHNVANARSFSTGGGDRSIHALSSLMKCLLYSLFFFLPLTVDVLMRQSLK